MFGLLLAKAGFPLLTVLTAAGAVAAIAAIVIAAVYAIRYIKATGSQAELAAKDEIINTNRQTIESLEQRLKTLSDDLGETNRRLKAAEGLIRSMKETIEERSAQYEALQKYTAPEAVKEMRELLTEQYAEVIKAYQENTTHLAKLTQNVAQEVAHVTLSEITNRLVQIQHELNPDHIFARTPSAGVGTWWWDTAQEADPYWSDEMLRILGLNKKINAKDFRDHVAPEDQQRYDDVLRQAIENKTPFDYTYTWIRPDNGRRVLVHSRGDYINSEKRRMVGTIEDITAHSMP